MGRKRKKERDEVWPNSKRTGIQHRSCGCVRREWRMEPWEGESVGSRAFEVVHDGRQSRTVHVGADGWWDDAVDRRDNRRHILGGEGTALRGTRVAYKFDKWISSEAHTSDLVRNDQ